MNGHTHASNLPRVAFVAGSLKLGGGTTFLCNLGGELLRRKIQAEVWSFEKENAHALDFAPLGIPVYCSDQRRNIYEDRLCTILEQLKLFNPTAVLATLSAVSFEVLRYVPAGVFRVGMGQSDDPAVYEMMAHYAPYMDLLAVVSQTMKRKAKAMTEFSRVPVVCLPYGVPIPRDEQMLARSFDGPLRILYLGRFDREQKRVHLFPAIFDQLKSSGIPFHWTLAGEGPWKNSLETAMKSLRADQTASFPGQIAYANMLPLLFQHDVFLLASDFEGLPLSLLEAMGAGLVPVVSDLPSGIPEVVDAANGMLVPVNDVEGYARAIIHLHEHRNELAAKSTAARERVQKGFSVTAMTDRWLAALPKEPPAIGAWPDTWDIKPPLPARHPIYFSPPVRMLRRLAARLR